MWINDAESETQSDAAVIIASIRTLLVRRDFRGVSQIGHRSDDIAQCLLCLRVAHALQVLARRVENVPQGLLVQLSIDVHLSMRVRIVHFPPMDGKPP